MRRREFITLLGGTVVWPLAAGAQQSERPIRLGLVPLGSPENTYDLSLVEAFRQGLRKVGLIENQNVILDVAWVKNDPNQAVSDVLRRGAQVLIPCGSSASAAAQRQTASVPIVFLSVGDPIAIGLVDNLARPGRNATGFSDVLSDVSGKLVDLARELNKTQTTLSYLWHTAWPDGQHRYDSTKEAAEKAGLKLQSFGIANIEQLNDALVGFAESGATVLIVQPSPLTYRYRGQIIGAAIKYGLGTIYAFPIAAREGSLIGYGPDYLHMYSRAPFYVDRILKGSKPSELPVELPTKLELLVNLDTAKTLGIEVPLALLVRADELLE